MWKGQGSVATSVLAIFFGPTLTDATETSETWSLLSAGIWGIPSFKKMFQVALVCLGVTEHEA